MKLLNAAAVAKLLGVNQKKAHEIIRKLNEELAEKGYLTFSGRIPRKYLEERCYGLTEGGSRQ